MNCKNCFKNGHCLFQCKKPINSYGVILYNNFPQKLTEPQSISSSYITKYLMIRRKHTLGFICIITGKYPNGNHSQLQDCIDRMTIYEKSRIVENSFDSNWEYLWAGHLNVVFSNKAFAQSKYESHASLILSMVSASSTSWIEPEWEFPKGRMIHMETELDCAMREFEEETNISRCNIRVITNVKPFNEIYLSCNNKVYKNTYYIANLSSDVSTINLLQFQEEEVSKMEWKDVNECLENIRPYNKEKKELIKSIDDMLKEYGVI